MFEEYYKGALRFHKDLYVSVNIDTKNFQTGLMIETIDPVKGKKLRATYDINNEDWSIVPINGGE